MYVYIYKGGGIYRTISRRDEDHFSCLIVSMFGCQGFYIYYYLYVYP
jgi:hypothetical protein